MNGRGRWRRSQPGAPTRSFLFSLPGTSGVHQDGGRDYRRPSRGWPAREGSGNMHNGSTGTGWACGNRFIGRFARRPQGGDSRERPRSSSARSDISTPLRVWRRNHEPAQEFLFSSGGVFALYAPDRRRRRRPNNNTMYGTGALANPTVDDLGDSAFGYNALHVSTSGTLNTAIGLTALPQQHHRQRQHRHRGQRPLRQQLRHGQYRQRSRRPRRQHHGQQQYRQRIPSP